MSDVWTAVDDWFGEVLALDDPGLSAALSRSDAAGLPAINVAPNQGRMLQILAEAVGARRILEIGTLGGYSTIWMARALPPDGRLVTLELDPRNAAVAAENIAGAGLADRVDILTGPAIETLERMVDVGEPPFDFTFIDADKPSNPEYFALALRLSRPGALIVVDNVVRGGAVVDPDGDASVQGVRRLHEALAREERVSATSVQTVGAKGYDGFTLIRVRT